MPRRDGRQLATCPHCGGDVLMAVRHNCRGDVVHAAVKCLKCEARAEGATESEAVDAWPRGLIPD